jgi:hypothetical protein
MIQTLFIFLTSIQSIHLLGKQNITPSTPPNSLFTSRLSISLSQWIPSSPPRNQPHPFHHLLFATIAPILPFLIFLCMIHFQAKLNASLTVSPLDWTFITTFSYGDCYWFDFFFLSPFLILGFLVFCFCSTWLLCCVAPLKFTCEGVGRIREKGDWLLVNLSFYSCFIILFFHQRP